MEPKQQGKQNNKILPRTRSGRVSTSKFVVLSSNNNAVVFQKGLNENLSLQVGLGNESTVRSFERNEKFKGRSKQTNVKNAKSTAKQALDLTAGTIQEVNPCINDGVDVMVNASEDDFGDLDDGTEYDQDLLVLVTTDPPCGTMSYNKSTRKCKRFNC